jgi:serine/threonine-protein kinase RsbT
MMALAPGQPAGRCAVLPHDTRHIHIDSDTSIIEARQLGRTLAESAGFGFTDLAMIATAISELARNVLHYAEEGDLTLTVLRHQDRIGLTIVATDRGPGIPDVALALQDGYSTSGNLGLGLPGVRRLMDEFTISSMPGHGTTVTATKWVR